MKSPSTPKRKFSFPPKFSFRRNWLIGMSLICVGVAGCAGLSEKLLAGKLSQGIITYKVTFPNISADNVINSLLPDKVTMCFKDGQSSINLESVGGVFKSKMVSNEKQLQIEQFVKIFKKRIRARLGEKDIESFNSELPDMTIIKTNQTDSIAGYLCHKAIGVYDDPSMPEINLYYTKDIDLKSPNWFNQYSSIDGVLMWYEIQEFGLKMRLEAVNVDKENIDKSIFKTDTTYSLISPEALKVQLDQLVQSFDL